MTSATDDLRKLLDERGIEWKDGDAAYEIEWSTPDGRHCSAMYWKPTFTVLVSGCTPEQAVAATLGAGEYKRGYEDGLHANTKAAFEAAKQAMDDGSRWYELFGTPERAAETMLNMPCGYKPCGECPIYEPCCGKYSEEHSLLEWLRGKAVS